MAKCFVSFFNALDGHGNNAMPCFYETFIKGLADAGNDVMVETIGVWDFNQLKCPSNVARQIKDFNPDVCFLFNNCFYDISDLVECPIVIYEVDSFLYYKNKEVLYNNPNRFYYFVPQTSSIQILQNELHIDKDRICYVPFFTEIRATCETLQNNICFVGSKFTNGDNDSIVRKFMLLNPSDIEKQQFKQCMNLINTNPYITIADLNEKFGQLSPNVISVLQSNTLLGYLSDDRRIKVLSSVADLGLSLRGTPNWLNDLAYDDLLMSYNPQKIYSKKDTEQFYNSHKIGININHIQATTGFGWRVADIMASNSCLVSEWRPDFENLFPNVPIPFFDNASDAYSVCKKLLDNEQMRLDIVAQCQEIIDKKYRFKHTLDIMQNFLGLTLICPDKVVVNTVCYLPSISCTTLFTKDKKIRKNRLKIRIKQIIYSFSLFSCSLPILHFIAGKKLQHKLKHKIIKYYE